MEREKVEAWLQGELGVSRETICLIAELEHLVVQESANQNLVSMATLSDFWGRHILDSAQLLLHRPAPDASWIDLGTGAGFPGLVVALLHPGRVTLVEERKLRVGFLTKAVESLDLLGKVEILGTKVERVPPRPFDVISARAFAPLARLLALAAPFSTIMTRWILPKGRNAQVELEAAESSWQGDFRLEPSLTDPEARIIVAEGVQARGKGKAG